MKEHVAMRHVLVWSNGALRVEPKEAPLADLVSDPQALIWVDVEGDLQPFEEDLINAFGISPLTVEMLEEQRERARFAEGEGYYYLAVHGLTFDAATGEGQTPTLDLLFGRTFLVTAHPETLPWLDALRQSAAGNGQIMGRGVPFLLHAVLDELVDSYFPVLDAIDEEIDKLENLTVAARSNAVQGRIFRLKRTLAQMRRVISPQVEVITSLVVRTGDLIPEAARPYFTDVHDHLVRAFEVLDSYRDLMSGLLDVYLTTVSNQLNAVMKQLTVYATIFFPITFITGMFGQNFGHSPQVEHDAGYNFWFVLIGMVLITLGQLAYFRWKKWI
jgi:magnesium transporter